MSINTLFVSRKFLFLVIFLITFILYPLLLIDQFNNSIVIFLFSITYFWVYILCVNSIKNKNYKIIMTVLFTLLYPLRIYYFLNINPIEGADEFQYFLLSQEINRSQNVLSVIANYFLLNFSVDIFAFVIPLIGFFYSFFFFLNNSESVLFILLFSSFILISTSLLLTSNYFLYKEKLIILIGVFFISPTMSYWGMFFFKDYISFFFIAITIKCFLSKRFIWFFIFLIIATVIRSYSLAIFVMYILYFRQSIKLSLGVAICAFLLSLIVYPGVLIKFVKIYLYMLFSPSPLNIENYDLFLFPQILESLFILLLFVFFLIKNVNGSRKFVINVFLCISIYSSCIYMVDNKLTYSWGLSQNIITENYHRKKIPLYPMYFLAITYLLACRRNVSVKLVVQKK